MSPAYVFSIIHPLFLCCAPGENRTHTPFEGHRVLSPARLPVPPPMHGAIVSGATLGVVADVVRCMR